MKKCVFIIEDRLKDMNSFFLFLHELLLNTRDSSLGEALTSDDVKIFFLHICWDEEIQAKSERDFETIKADVQNRVKQVAGVDAFKMQYHSVLWENESYDPGSSKTKGDELFKQIEKLQGKECSPGEPGAERGYVVLMDVILNDDADKDLSWLAEEHDIPTSCLYRSLTGDRCIVYSKYPKAIVLEKWKRLAKMSKDENVFPRVYLTRSRAVYVPLEEKLHKILGLARNLE